MVVLGIAAFYFGSAGDGPEPRKQSPAGRTSVEAGPGVQPNPADALRDRLVRAGWTAPAARAFADQNGALFPAIATDAPDASAKLLAELERLGQHGSVMAILADYPELTGLCVVLRDSEPVRTALAGPKPDLTTFTAMMLLAPSEHRPALIRLFTRYGSVIAKLHQHGLPGAEALFLDSRAGSDHAGDRAYEDWLARTLERRLRDPDDRLDEFLQIVLEHGHELRARLRNDTGFRRRFADELWPALERLASDPEHPLELWLDDLAVWDVLQRKDGEELLRKHGMAAVAVLYGERAWPEAARDRLGRVLLVGGSGMLEGLLKGPYRYEPRFRNLFVESNLPDEALADIVVALHKKGLDYGPTLDSILQAQDSPERLKALLGPSETNVLEWVPFYIQISVARKMLLDERIKPEEWNELCIDTVMTAVPFGKLMKTGGKVATQTLKAAVKEEAGKQLARKAATTATRSAETAMAVAVTSGAARKASERLVVRWTITETIRTKRRAAMTAVSERMALDITRSVRFFYLHSGLGRTWFKRLTGLEARIFMRPDGRIVLHLDRLGRGMLFEYLKSTLIHELKASKAGGAPVPDQVDTEPHGSDSPPSRRTDRDPFDPKATDVEAARRNAAAVFLLEAAGLLNGSDPPSPGNR
ncbi:MAG: hypothetical protein KF873_03125 [Gemmataceae bacterium]|nr:hypothetical protein [Gemmataceae bacterium]